MPLLPLYRRSALQVKLRGEISAANNPLSIPVVVVGNITVGGTGKSPVVVSLVRELQKRGYRPGVLSRGYGAKVSDAPQVIAEQDSAELVGDEPLMMCQALTDVPVVVDRDRCRGAHYLQSICGVDLVICDDGLQHYALPRDIEILVLDAERGLGNGQLIPVGPLRETPDRLQSVDYVLANGPSAKLPAELVEKIDFEFSVAPKCWRNLLSGEAFGLDEAPLSGRVLAVSAIGNPARFHKSLFSLGLQAVAVDFPDHHQFKPADFDFPQEQANLPLVMTAKDAVKCHAFAKPDWWVLDVEAQLPESFVEPFIRQLDSLLETKRERT